MILILVGFLKQKNFILSHAECYNIYYGEKKIKKNL